MLTLVQVTKIYGTHVIFKHITACIEPGVTLLVGANGAGKSTLLRIMAGLSRPTGGAVDCAVDPARIGYLGHTTFIYPGLTAWENLDFWQQVYGCPRTKGDVDAALERVALHTYAHERAGIFSRGMSQRLSLARVLMLTPDIFLLDEPSTGLDAPSAALLREEIDKARQRGATIVWISHQIDVDLPLADRVLALHKGRLAYDGLAFDFRGLGATCCG